ncbi:MAG: hypothetical protein DCF22_14110 [Leptolyngbya sp.]|nr:MAG: hypothetical protein DCF22_14110 [Leptolyngbya sp.]
MRHNRLFSTVDSIFDFAFHFDAQSPISLLQFKALFASVLPVIFAVVGLESGGDRPSSVENKVRSRFPIPQ